MDYVPHSDSFQSFFVPVRYSSSIEIKACTNIDAPEIPRIEVPYLTCWVANGYQVFQM